MLSLPSNAAPTHFGIEPTRIAVLDDWQGVARSMADWSALESRAAVTFFQEPLADAAEAAEALAPFDLILAMRERTPFPAALIDRLPRLKMFSLTGHRGKLLDLGHMTARGITVCVTEAGPGVESTAELTLGLILAAARDIPMGDRQMRAGAFQRNVRAGTLLAGKNLGIMGLGNVGARMATYGRALGMNVLAWSQHLTAEAAAVAGAQRVSKDELIATADVVTLHLVLSDRTHHILGSPELEKMRDGAILVNTSRAGLIDEVALAQAVGQGRVIAAMDVFPVEPYRDGSLLKHPNTTVLTPHLGYGCTEVFAVFYRQLIENALAFLDGRPIRTLDDASGSTAFPTPQATAST